jgi:hypothetical protein
VKGYYSHRSSIPGFLHITEITLIATKAGSSHNVPGRGKYPCGKRYEPDCILAALDQPLRINACTVTLKVTDSPHQRIVYSPPALGAWTRRRYGSLELDDPFKLFEHVVPSPIPLPDLPSVVPVALTTSEIDEFVQLRAGREGCRLRSWVRWCEGPRCEHVPCRPIPAGHGQQEDGCLQERH